MEEKDAIVRRFHEAIQTSDFALAIKYIVATPDLVRALNKIQWHGIWSGYSEDRAQFWEALFLQGIISPEQAWEINPAPYNNAFTLSAWSRSFFFGTKLTRRFLEQHALNSPHFRDQIVNWKTPDQDYTEKNHKGDDLFAWAFYYHAHHAIQPMCRIWQSAHRIPFHSIDRLFREIFLKTPPDIGTLEYVQDLIQTLQEWMTLKAALDRMDEQKDKAT